MWSSLAASNTRERIEREWMGPRSAPRNGASETRTRNREGEGIWTSENKITGHGSHVFFLPTLYTCIRCTYTLARIPADRRDRALRSRMRHLMHARMHMHSRESNLDETRRRRRKKHKERRTEQSGRAVYVIPPVLRWLLPLARCCAYASGFVRFYREK